MKTQQISLSIDWLQVQCRGQINTLYYSDMALLPYSTRHFKEVYTLKIGNIEKCVITCKPFSSVLSPDMVIIKFNNKLLYSASLFEEADEIIKNLGLTYKSLSRLDLCIDFQKFAHNLQPDIFLTKIAHDKYLKNGRADVKMKGNAPEYLEEDKNACRKNEITIQGTQKQVTEWQYLRYGNNNSLISMYMYNKTRELQEVKDKPYIRAKWEQAGFDMMIDTYRIEATLKSDNIHALNMSTGEIDKITFYSIRDIQFRKELTFSLIQKYFSFKYNNNTRNKTRMQDVKLFNTDCTIKDIKVLTNELDNGRSERIFIKKLEQFNSEIRAIRERNCIDHDYDFEAGQKVLKEAILVYGKAEWYEKRIKNLFG